MEGVEGGSFYGEHALKKPKRDLALTKLVIDPVRKCQCPMFPCCEDFVA